MRERVLDFDPETGTRSTFVYDDASDSFQIVTEQRVGPTLALNRELRKHADRRTRWREMTRVASIPLVVVEDLRRRGILDDDRAFRRWLNDPANKVFRVREGDV